MKLPPGARPYALIVAAIAVTYANSLTASFQFDDWNVIVDEPKVHSLAAWWGSMPGIRPLLKLSYALSWTISESAWAFRLGNIAIHGANACLVFFLLRKRTETAVALVTSLIFALHPAQTEAVTYITGRSVSLSALFALGCLATTGWVSALLFSGGLLVKETVAVLVVLRRRLIPLLIVFSVLAILTPTYRHLLQVSLDTRSIGTNLLTQAHGVTYLIGQLYRIHATNADPKLPEIASWSPEIAANAALIVSLIAVGFALLRFNRPVGFAILWFFLWLLPTNSILPRLDVANDRQLYLPLLGPAFLAAHGLGTVARRHGNLFPWGAAVVLLAALATATHLRNRDYRDEITFWDETAAAAPHNARAFNNLGYALVLAGRDDEADLAYSRAIELDPGYVKAKVNLRLLREGYRPKPRSAR